MEAFVKSFNLTGELKHNCQSYKMHKNIADWIGTRLFHPSNQIIVKHLLQHSFFRVCNS